jgi:adenine-specific methyltransferase EcoRI-like protein
MRAPVTGPILPLAMPSAGAASTPAPSKNQNLQAARAAKEDEFYTQLRDIEKELQHYKAHFSGQTVYLNCDDPHESNFFRYFFLNFHVLGLKRLIATSYVGRTLGKAVAYTYDGQQDSIGSPDPDTVRERPITGSGDFRSPECVALLKEADIVVTNPPFSLFREYINQLITHDKKFLIVGSQNAATSNEIFPLILSGKVWLGYHSGDMKFTVPTHYAPRKVRYWVDETGQKWRSLGNVCWYTNLVHPKRHANLGLYKTYTPADYPTYVNYDAIEVSRVANIPVDYPGKMGVPITFLNKWNPEQYELLGTSATLSTPMSKVVPGQKGTGRFYLKEPDGYDRLYERVVIRRKATP